jgi:hypothetical protein
MPIATDSGYLPDWLKALLGQAGSFDAGGNVATPSPMGLFSEPAASPEARTGLLSNSPTTPFPTFTQIQPTSPIVGGTPAGQGQPIWDNIGPSGAPAAFTGVRPDAPMFGAGNAPDNPPSDVPLPPRRPADLRDFQTNATGSPADINTPPQGQPNSNVIGTQASGAPEVTAQQSSGFGGYLGKASDLIGSIYGAGGPGDALIALGLSNRTNGASVQALNASNASRLAQTNLGLKQFELAQKQRATNSTYNALVKAGADPANAQAAVDAAAGGNTTLLKALSDRYFSSNEYAVTKDAYGNPIAYNKNDPGEVIPVGGKGGSGTGPGEGTAGGLINDSNGHLKGEEFLATVPPNMANRVRQIVEGREAWPTGYSSRSPDIKVLKELVTQADPNYDFTNASARKKTRDQFASTAPSAPGNVIQIGNAVLGHLGQLSDAVVALENNNLPALNAIKQGFQKAFGTSVNLTSFEGLRDRYVEEITRFYRGAGGAERDIEREINALKSTKSPAELQSAIATAADAIQSKVAAVQHTWHAGMGDNVPDYNIFNPEGIAAMGKIASRDPRKLFTPRDATGNPVQAATPVVAAPAAPVAAAPAAGSAAAAPASDPLAAARDAIARGADPQAVKNRLIKAGINPAGL